MQKCMYIDVCIYILELVDPSRNRLASTAYQKKPGFSVLRAQVCNIKIKNTLFFSKVVRKDPESAEQKEKTIFQIFPIFIFQVYFSDFYLHACKTLKPGFFWYAVDTNLFRLGSTNPKKKIPDPGSFFSNYFFQKCSNIFEQTFLFLFKSVQI